MRASEGMGFWVYSVQRQIVSAIKTCPPFGFVVSIISPWERRISGGFWDRISTSRNTTSLENSQLEEEERADLSSRYPAKLQVSVKLPSACSRDLSLLEAQERGARKVLSLPPWQFLQAPSGFPRSHQVRVLYILNSKLHIVQNDGMQRTTVYLYQNLWKSKVHVHSIGV